LVTDHKPLVGICNNTEPSNNHHLKWVTTLSALQVKVQFEEVRKNVIADALSRMDTMNKMEELEKEGNEVVLVSQNIENFINSRIIEIEGKKYYKQNGRLSKIIKDEDEKFRLIETAHTIGHEECVRIIN